MRTHFVKYQSASTLLQSRQAGGAFLYVCMLMHQGSEPCEGGFQQPCVHGAKMVHVNAHNTLRPQCKPAFCQAVRCRINLWDFGTSTAEKPVCAERSRCYILIVFSRKTQRNCGFWSASHHGEAAPRAGWPFAATRRFAAHALVLAGLASSVLRGNFVDMLVPRPQPVKL